MIKQFTNKLGVNTAIIDLFFILCILLSPLIFKIGFKDLVIDTNVVFVFVLGLWGLTKTVCSKLILKKILWLDIGVIVLIVYATIHFIFLSNASLYYPKLWTYISYILVFYLLRFSLNKEEETNFILFGILLLIVFTGLLQSFVALLQYFEVITAENEYFTLLGSFTSPNYLSEYLGLTLIILIWWFLTKKPKKKMVIGLGILCFAIFLGLIVLSKSRGAWLSILASIGVLVITSKKAKQILTKLSVIKKLVLSIAIIAITLFGVKYMYHLKPDSVDGRKLVAKISLQEIAKKPITGHGLFSFAGKYNKAKATYFESEKRPWEEVKNGTYSFNPFNDYILIAFEFGVLALIIVFILIGFCIFKTEVNTKTRLGLALFINVCVFAVFNSPLSRALLIFIALFGLVLMLRYGGFNKKRKKQIFPSNNFIIKPSIFVLSLLGLYLTVFKLANHNKFLKLSLKDHLLGEFFYLSNAIEDNSFSKSIIGEKLYYLGYREEGKKYMEYAYKNSSAPKIGNSLARIYLREQNHERREDIYRFNMFVEPYRYESRMDLLALYESGKQDEKAFKMAQEVLDLPVKIPSQKITTYKKVAEYTKKSLLKSVEALKNIKGKLSEEKVIKSKLLQKDLPYKVYFPPMEDINKEVTVMYLNDGYDYINRGEIIPLLDSLIVHKKIVPVAAVFLNPKDKVQNSKNVRDELFICNPEFKDFFVTEFIPEIEASYKVSKHNRSIVGISFGGLAAAYIADQEPTYFKNVIMQSPVFNKCYKIFHSYEDNPKHNFKIYLSYGTGTDTESQNIPLINILKTKGYNLKVNQIEDAGHNWENWGSQLEDILIYYFGVENE